LLHFEASHHFLQERKKVFGEPILHAILALGIDDNQGNSEFPIEWPHFEGWTFAAPKSAFVLTPDPASYPLIFRGMTHCDPS
jgi:hypothetical protein